MSFRPEKGLSLGFYDKDNQEIRLGDHFIDLRNNTEWIVEYSKKRFEFVARSGETAINALKAIKCDTILKLR